MRLGDRFAEALSDYDTQRRVRVLIDDFLGEKMVAGKSVLDVGYTSNCFTTRAVVILPWAISVRSSSNRRDIATAMWQHNEKIHAQEFCV